MAGKSANLGNWSPGSPTTRYKVSGKNREFYTFENAPGLGAYATGGTIIDGGDGYIYHIFTGNGTFTVNRPPAAIDSVDYFIVAGGGGHSPSALGGGGGGGGFTFGNTGVSNAPGSYSITVGAGGPNSPSPTSSTRNGSPSTAFGFTAFGGGGGGQAGPPALIAAGANGGSGGGGGNSAPGSGGVGNIPASIPRQGYPGGSSAPTANGSGGGGAGGLGANGASGVAGSGGPGRIAPAEFLSTIIRRAIPAAVLPSWEPLVVPGGYAAGGVGSPFPAPLQRNTPANSGYGGNFVNSNGGSGIVCVRYRKTAAYSRATGGTIEPSTHPEHPGVWRHIFTEPGTFTVTDPSLQWIEYLGVGGGGGGGSAPGSNRSTGGGGGAGGFVTSIETSTTTPLSIPEAYSWNLGSSVRVGKQMPVGAAAYPIGIGTGGNSGSTGSNTTIGSPGPSQIIAYGGGAGTSSNATPGGSGASGGGVGKPFSNTTGTGGAASPSPLIQGMPGGSFPGFPTNPSTGSGGGGAGASGGNGPSTTNESGLNNPPVGGGIGGVGWYSVLSPSSYGTPGPVAGYRYFAGGGGSGGGTSPAGPGAPITSTGVMGRPGGAGGGGTGGDVNWTGIFSPPYPTATATPGTTNTGGGGGGGGGGYVQSGGTGGPGIVIIQYPE
jgi:hypothetical protein